MTRRLVVLSEITLTQSVNLEYTYIYEEKRDGAPKTIGLNNKEAEI